MPTLEWIGKKSVVNHHREVPFRLLQSDPALSVGDPDSGNLLVQGDNLEALKALLPYYAGKVKCIYIDPPYNTGNEGWIYNDNVTGISHMTLELPSAPPLLLGFSQTGTFFSRTLVSIRFLWVQRTPIPAFQPRNPSFSRLEGKPLPEKLRALVFHPSFILAGFRRQP